MCRKIIIIPFGLNITALGKKGKPNSRWQGNGRTELESNFDLFQYETPFRGYDPQLGRFKQVEPLADLYPGISTYQFAFNNPIYFNNPTGLSVQHDEPNEDKPNEDGNCCPDFNWLYDWVGWDLSSMDWFSGHGSEELVASHYNDQNYRQENFNQWATGVENTHNVMVTTGQVGLEIGLTFGAPQLQAVRAARWGYMGARGIRGSRIILNSTVSNDPSLAPFITTLAHGTLMYVIPPFGDVDEADLVIGGLSAALFRNHPNIFYGATVFGSMFFDWTSSYSQESVGVSFKTPFYGYDSNNGGWSFDNRKGAFRTAMDLGVGNLNYYGAKRIRGLFPNDDGYTVPIVSWGVTAGVTIGPKNLIIGAWENAWK